MVKKTSDHGFEMMAIVAIIAVVGLVMMFMNSGGVKTSSGNEGSENLAGEAVRNARNPYAYTPHLNIAEQCEWVSEEVDVGDTGAVATCNSGELLIDGFCSHPNIIKKNIFNEFEPGTGQGFSCLYDSVAELYSHWKSYALCCSP
tara:strand:+ start:180 stop:614 length:435 start_codon:yes stop_codon:yes gene_type:complete